VGNETIRASARIQMNEIDPFVKFDVELNEIPIKNDKIGKDIVVDWYFYDHFDTAGDIFVDANGLEMINKKINWRKEFTYNSNETISANYYPVTSAIAIRDKNESNFNKTGVKKQITILNDRSQGGSAGLRERRNIELMQHRRFKKSDYYGVFEPDNDLDKHGRGIQVLSSYYLMLNDHNKNGSSRQREI
jgi:lysosomal alpha-mannosidase|tara:strand:+ start:1420 stop:1989 length:570 start_codon:yes stop_codon:yes gene_type:complete